MQEKQKNSLKSGTNVQSESRTNQKEASRQKPQSSILTGCLGCLGMLVALVLIGIVIVAIVEEKDNDEHKAAVASPVVENSTVNGIEDKVRSSITKAIGDTTNMDEQRVVSLQVNDHSGTVQEGDKIVVASLRGNDNLTAGMIKGGMQMDSIKVFKALFQIPGIEEVALLWQFPTVDDYGNSASTTALKITLTKETAAKINWSGFDKDNFEKVADSYWESPAIREKKSGELN
ncbi:hypothetical protein [Cohnella rhizosphaerae]|uniref:Uncharacterized protein n=1 Tax=Cohnella rhizosphaerae TaxID=1457232 RepID=A0A9X4KZR5_9BACL|nr:hypothetical protein [Cohnella rhizosphaerae]MDG0814215.1 hypothetical protein [Cohnella rhizosphaerae]